MGCDDMPSLVFSCLFLWAPSLCALTYSLWTRHENSKLYHRHLEEGRRCEGVIEQKQASAVSEYRGAPDAGFLESGGHETYETGPYHLWVHYEAPSSGTTVTKKLSNVSKVRYNQSNEGDQIELSVLPAQDSSAIILEELKITVSSAFEMIALRSFLSIAAFGACTLNAQCLGWHGWFVVGSFAVAAFALTLFVLQRSFYARTLALDANPSDVR